MKLLISFFILFAAVIFQAAFLKNIGSAGSFLNPVLIILLYSVFFGGNYKTTMFAALFSGLLLDGLSGLPFGYMTFSSVAVVFTAFALLSLVLRDSFWHFLFFIAAGTALYDFVLIIIMVLARGAGAALADISVFGPAMAIELAANVAAAALLYRLRKWIIL